MPAAGPAGARVDGHSSDFEKPGQNRPYFSALRQLFVDIKSKKYDNTYMDCLSMGMTRDFCDAIAEGSTLVRIGTGIYGPRMYKEEH